MATPTEPLLIDELVTVLRSFLEGATIDQIQGALAHPVDRQKVKSALDLLVRLKRIVLNGDCYRVVPSQDESPGLNAQPSVAPTTSPVTAPAPAPVADVSPARTSSGGPGGAAPDQSGSVQPSPFNSTAAAAPQSAVGRQLAAAPQSASKLADPRTAPPPTPPVSPSAPAPVTDMSSARENHEAASDAAPDRSFNSQPSTFNSAAAGAAAKRFDELFEICVLTIIPGMMPKLSAAGYLQSQAMHCLEDKNERRAFVADAKERLLKFTAADAERYEIDPELFEAWREAYLAGATAPAAEVTPAEPPDDAKVRAGSPKRATNARASSPRGIAKLIADQVTKLTGGKGPVLHIVVTTLALALITPLIQWLTRSPLVTIAIVAVVIAAVLLIAWARGGPEAKKPETGDDIAENDNAPGDAADDAVAAENAPRVATAVAPVRAGRSRRGRTMIAAGALVLIAAAVAGGFWYRSTLQGPSTAEVRDHLNATMASLPVRVVTLDVKLQDPGASGCSLTYQGVLETTAPLYRRLDTSEYLRAHAADEMTAIDAARALLTGPNGARLRSRAGAAPAVELVPPPASRSMLDPQTAGSPAPALQLLATQTPPGFSIMTSGTLFAWRRNGTWSFTEQQSAFDRSRLPGEPKPAGGAALAVDEPADAARLKTLLAEHVAYAAKIQASVGALTADLERDRRQKAEALVQLLRPGTLFTGVVHTTRGETHTVVLEIAEHLATTRRVTALLRNEGGWADARRFRGEWTLDADGACALTLRTQGEDRLPDAGPLLQDMNEGTIALQLRPDGTATGTPGQWQLRRVEPDAVAALKAEISAAVAPVLAATQAGKVYRGTATRPASGPNTAPVTYALLLRFVAQDPGSLALRATLEAPNFAGASRAFHGTIIDNTYRAGSTPIRLLSPDNARVPQADPKSPLGLNTNNDSLTLALRVEGDRLIGQDGRFSYQFEPLPTPTAPQSPGQTQATNQDPLTTAPTDVPVSAVTAVPDFSTLRGPGAYALIDGRWVALPENNGRILQSKTQALTVKLIEFNLWQDKQAGKTSEPSKDEVAAVTFDGKDSVPVVEGNDVVLLYIGRVTPPPLKDVEAYPILKDAPPIELAPTKTQRNGTRTAALYVIAPGYLGFSANGIKATITQPAKDSTLLQSPAPLPAGRYALFCGARSYEVVVR